MSINEVSSESILKESVLKGVSTREADSLLEALFDEGGRFPTRGGEVLLSLSTSTIVSYSVRSILKDQCTHKLIHFSSFRI
jgi:hypothetical protein